MLNVELLQRVKAHVLAEPNRLDMSIYCDRDSGPDCKTAWCIAGWSVALSFGEDEAVRLANQCGHFIERAEELLGIHAADSGALFFSIEWPRDLYEQYVLGSDEERAAACAERIDRFIAEHAPAEPAKEGAGA